MKKIQLNNFLKYMILTIKILYLTILLVSCRNVELEEPSGGDPIRGNGLILNYLFSNIQPSAGSSNNNSRYNFIKSGNVVYGYGDAGTKASIVAITSPESVNRASFDIPNCTSSSSSTNSVYCIILTLSVSGDQAKAIAAKIVANRQSGSGEVTSEASLYIGIGSATNLSGMVFTSIDNGSIGLTDLSRLTIFNPLDSATDGTNFVFRFPDGNNSRYCGTNNNGSSWTCETVISGGQEFVRNFGGTMAIGARRRWNGTAFINTTATNTFRFGTEIGSRTYFPSNTPQFTDTAAASWTNPITLSTGNFSTTPSGTVNDFFELNANLHLVFSQDSGTGSAFARTYSIHRTTDNGLNYNLIQTLDSNSPILNISRPNTIKFIGLGSIIYANVEGQNERNFFTTKLVYTSDFSNWVELQ
ncbi:hypothetical protein [Leptospira sp. GIMC2001]|uniref:hypothetical protein n=1 Tax=Leptospira sp. GIMC2001 TaxID=1513297 RepID=UPI00234BE0DF|nr:hypothetical protein [Leptospira sp. GIMC2001]WCL49627.1 hypothetical protein O4O04_02075 [Leptospira sp. GIMC2001]